MLHEEATTRFILQSLSASILVSFSIRQGDPLAMLLYIFYIEPFLISLENCLTGLRLQGPVQDEGPVEVYCEYTNK